MDNILEILVPLIFAAIYFFGNMLSGKSDQEDPSPGMPGRRNREVDEEAAERQRKIQEEIRRKIMERRGASDDGAPAQQPVPTQTAQRETGLTRADEEMRRRREEIQRRREQQDRERQEREEAARAALARQSQQPAVPEFVPATEDPPYDAYENQMESRLKRIEETKRQAARLQQQAAAAKKKAASSVASKRGSSGGLLRGPVRESLNDPAAARAAFIYGEVLGRPIGLRGSESAVPGLSK